jgi:spore coat polysaccharide biosynthesis protein SpsF (cytidylyltransferase family)
LKKDIGIIIQARLSSSRFPAKLLQPFSGSDLLIDVIIKKFLLISNDFSIILATTTSTSDDKLVSLCNKYPVSIFRGSENNVLQRFIDAANAFRIEKIIRVCSDNPFFDVAGTLKLLDFVTEDVDYVSYKMNNGLPAIKSHLGFWGEFVTLAALKKVSQLTKMQIYTEHVTNYIYSHPEKFQVNLVNAPNNTGNKYNMRFTLDTPEDYRILKELYNEIEKTGKSQNPSDIVEFVRCNDELSKTMKTQVLINSK